MNKERSWSFQDGGKLSTAETKERHRTGKDLEQWDGRLAPVTLCNTAVT